MFPLAALLLAAAPPVRTDALVESFVSDALQRRPEIAAGLSLVDAEQQRIPQASALPDPVLSLGLQNDSFTRYSVGTMETSWYSIMATQAFPWPSKLSARSAVARVSPRIADAALQRVRLSVEAEVRRAYVELLLVRDQLELLGRIEELWKKSEALARTRYSVGEGPQSDVLRAQLELTRLQQQRLSLDASERARLAALNRARGHALDDAVATPRGLEDLGVPLLADAQSALSDAEDRSPELRAARLSSEQAGARTQLARSERLPDFSAGLGVMPRGALEPMWQDTVGISLPVYAAVKQNRAVAEAASRSEAAAREAQALLDVLRLRTVQRHTLLEAALKTAALYRDVLLIQSEATVTSTLAQYGTGKVPFAAVLEALGGYLADRSASLEALAQAHRVSIAQLELSLEDPSRPAGPVSAGPAMPSSTLTAPGAARGAAPAGDSSSSTLSPMGGM
jgi:outer membrane protein, heavy metal efflux system